MEMTEVKRVPKEWGEEIWMANNNLYCGKKLILKKGKRVSYHKHKNKDETFFIESGKVLMKIDGEEKVLNEGDAVRIKPGTLHRYAGIMDAVMVEISTHHEDDDTYREEDELSGDVPQKIMEEFKDE